MLGRTLPFHAPTEQRDMNVVASTLVITTAAALLTACAQQVWVRPGAGPQQFEADRYACERDSRQSGGFGGGLIGAIEVQNFYNRCMVSKGWQLRDQASHNADVAVTNSTAQAAQQERRECLARVRQQPRFASITSRFSDPQTNRYNFAQMSSADTPTPAEAAVWTQYVTETDTCIDAFIARIGPLMTPEQRTAFNSSRSEVATAAAQLARRQITWGEFSTRINQSIDRQTSRN